MMREMRKLTKYLFGIMLVAFVGWLVFSVGMGGGGTQRSDVVLKVNGREVHLPEYEAALQSAYEQFRRQSGGTLTREDEQQVQNEVIDQFTQALLLDQQYKKLGITVSDEELIQAAQSSPPPDVMQAPEFQTNGQFDITKWQRYLSSAADPEFLRAIEARYRQQIPQVKLAQYLTADIYIPDGKLWRIYRDQHESVTVAAVPFLPQQVTDQEASVSDADLEAYYAAHKVDFKRPAVAFLSFIAQPRLPDAADSAAALARARSVRETLLRGAKFEDVAKRESADTVSGAKGGDLGWMKRNEEGFDPQFVAGLKTLHPGAVSPPVQSTFGYHLIKIDEARGDSVHVRHILIPMEPQGAHLDFVEARADTLDKLAAEQADGGVLDSVARRLNLPLAHAPRLLEGDRMVLGRYVIPDVSVWAFESPVGETSPVIEGRPAYYVFRLDSLSPAGTPPLARIRQEVTDAARLAKKREIAARRAAQLAQELGTSGDLLAAAAAHGLTGQKLGPFSRLAPPPLLQSFPLAVGAAFGLRPGNRSGLIPGRDGAVIVQALSRVAADSAAWLKQRDTQREGLLQPARQGRIQAYLAALKAQAKIVDRRKQLFAPQAASGA